MFELFLAYQATGDIKVRNTLVKLNLGLARKAAHALSRKGTEPYEDLENEAAIGLIKAVERFDPSLGNKFSSFAMPYITGKVQQYFRDKGHTIRLTQGIQSLHNKGKKAHEHLTVELSRTPTLGEVAAYLKVGEDKYTEAVGAVINTRNLVSIDSESENYLSEYS